MTVHALMPVFNRLSMTKSAIDCLRRQEIDDRLIIIIVDDGSTDGTKEYLETQSDIIILLGNGNLWWGGAIDLGLRYILSGAADTDMVLLLNNDTIFDQYFLQSLLTVARCYSPAAVQASVLAPFPPNEILSVGPFVDPWRFRVVDALDWRPELLANLKDVIEIDALSGRGVLYPVPALRAIGGINRFFAPHYFADYQLSIRVRRAGFRLYSALDCQVISIDDFGNSLKPQKLLDRYFSVSSSAYLPAFLYFWWTASSLIQKISFPFRLVVYFLSKLVRVIA